MNRRLGVLISGRGSNLQAIISAISTRDLDAEIAIVISNRADAQGLVRARTAGIETLIVDSRDKAAYPTREDYDRAVVSELKKRDVSLVCLAGFMRLLSPFFVQSFRNAILNVHPSLLPAFPGTNAQYQAWEHGVKQAGATVHLVNEELDGGPIVCQQAVAVHDDDDADSLAARILEQEHLLYPEAIRRMLDGDWVLEGRRFVRKKITTRPLER